MTETRKETRLVLVAKSKTMLFFILNALILSVKMDFATSITFGGLLPGK